MNKNDCVHDIIIKNTRLMFAHSRTEGMIISGEGEGQVVVGFSGGGAGPDELTKMMPPRK